MLCTIGWNICKLSHGQERLIFFYSLSVNRYVEITQASTLGTELVLTAMLLNVLQVFFHTFFHSVTAKRKRCDSSAAFFNLNKF